MAEVGEEIIHTAKATYGRCWWEMTGYTGCFVRAKFGPGNYKAAKAALKSFDDVFDKSGSGATMKLLANVRQVGFAGPRVQLLMGRWFLKNRHRMARIAITDAGRVQTVIVSTIFRIGGIERMRFFYDEGEAERWVLSSGLLTAGSS